MSTPTLAGPRRSAENRAPARVRRPGPRAALPTGLAAASTCGALLALDPVLGPGDWTATAMLAVLALATVVGAVRGLRPGAAAATLVGTGLVAAVLLVVNGFGAGSSGLADVVGDGLEQIRVGVVPLAPGPAVTTFVVVGALAVFLLLDLSVALHAPVLGGLAPLTLWIPAIVLGFPASGWALFWTGLPWLLLVSDVSSAGRSERMRRCGLSVALLVAALVLAPVAAAVPGWASGMLPALGTGGSVTLSDDLDLRRDLLGQSGQPLLRYRTSGTDANGATVTPAGLGTLRSFTLRQFDGRTWHPDDDASDLVPVWPDRLLDPTSRRPVAPDPGSGTTSVEVEVVGLADHYLPVTTAPRTLDIAGQWQYDPVRDQVVGDAPTRSGTRYTMRARPVAVNARTLAGLDTTGLADPDPYLAVPQSTHRGDVAALAAQVVGPASTPYAKAVALQAFFRTGGAFSYDARVAPAATDDAVWDFLRDRRGYCVQFATAMAIMARTLGLPARIGVGFLPGAIDESGTATVTGHEAHAWPELWFSGVGWVRFEPTPAVQTGAPPAWTVPAVGPTTGPQPDNLGAGAPAAQPSAAASSSPVPAGAGSVRSTGGTGWMPPIAVGVVLVALAVVLVGLGRSRRRTTLDAERAWAQAGRACADAGLGWSTAMTPRRAVAHVRAVLRVDEADAPGAARAAAEALHQLADEVERQRYAPPGPAAAPERLLHQVQALRNALRLLPRTRSGRPTSSAGRVAPPEPPATPPE